MGSLTPPTGGPIHLNAIIFIKPEQRALSKRASLDRIRRSGRDELFTVAVNRLTVFDSPVEAIREGRKIK
ncbi:MAG: hypothetical protein F4X58_12665 [Chloroflexi bacterium]|nr:hypothetical protein [Chloroflexota bacterium]MYC02763.1 hypothetical protein [Chloroflexota bacterium]